LATDEVKQKARHVAAKLLECDVDDLIVDGGRVHIAGVPASGVSLAEVAKAARGVEFLGEQAEPGLSSTRYFLPESVTWAAGAHGAIVEICPDTGVVSILKYVAAHDAGREINSRIVEGQVHGGIAQGIGSALLEQIVYDAEGQLLTGSLMDYCLPRASDLPFFESKSVPCLSTVNPLGIKGAGEGGTIPGQAIIANAIADALGFEAAELNRVPFRSEQIFRLANGATA
jgi:carbon-monoxide dehydrogenase large subunit